MKKTYYLFKITLLMFLSVCLSTCNNNSNKSCKIPSIKNFNDTIHFIKNVKTYLVETADRGLFTNDLCTNFYTLPFENVNVSNFIDIFEKDSGVTSCGLSALLMAKILNDNGINAYTYNFGIKNSQFAHVICLVEYKNKLIVIDPYMNFTVVNEKNELLDFFEMINLIKQQEMSKVILQTDTISCDFIIDLKTFAAFPIEKIPDDCIHLYKSIEHELKSNKLLKKKQKIYFGYKEFECNDFIKGIQNELQKNGRSADFKEVFLKKINSVSGSLGFEALNTKIDSALAH